MEGVARLISNQQKRTVTMKRIICLVASLAFLANAEAQYSSKKNTGDFNGIDISSAARVNLIQSDSNYVSLSSKDSMKKVPKMEVHGGILEISSSFRGTMDVHVKNITSIKVSDAARVECKDTLKTDNLVIHVSDAGRADILVHAKVIKAKANDAGSITLSGTVDTLAVKVSDASRVNAGNLKAGTVQANSSDGSSASVWATKSIEARATDGSNVHVKGNPAQKNTSASDGGSVSMDDTGVETTQFDGDHDFMHMSTTDSNGKKIMVLKTNGDAFIGMGFVTGASKNGASVLYGRSREFIVGVGGGHKFCKWNELGFDVYYKSTDFFLAQGSSKSFPDSIHHKSEKVSFQNFGGLVFDRFYFGRHIFLDGGVYGDWTFHNKHITWDNNIPEVGSVKTIDRNLNFVNPTNYGITARFGSTKGLSLYFNYRLSALFQSNTPAYPELPAYVFGITLGGF